MSYVADIAYFYVITNCVGYIIITRYLNDKYIILYCAMAILYHRAVHIHVHVDWILDALGSTP